MNAPTPIPRRVRKLVPMLGSPQDGEALGAARAIERTLTGVGLDLHALAAAIQVEGEHPERPTEHVFAEAEEAYPRWRERRSAWADEHRQRFGPRSYGDWREAWAKRHRRHRHFTPLQEARQRDQVRFCQSHSAHLGPREREFIRDIAKIHDGLSIAQADYLADLADRLDQEVRTQWQ